MGNIVIDIKQLNKFYKLYNTPMERLKEALSITKKQYYTEHYALSDINIQVKQGEILGLVGSNGSGKSTLLKIITGVLTPSSGEVIVNGTISALLELGTGFNPEYTGIQNIYLYGTMLGKSKEEIDGQVEGILEFANIGEFIHQPVKTYSSGMFARLAFSVAINVEPDILIVDEILAVGDLRFQLKCMNKMKQMMSNGTTVLFVSHDINAIKRFCTKAIWLNRGIVMEYGDVDRVTDIYLDYLKIEENSKDMVNTKDNNSEKVEQSVQESYQKVSEIDSNQIAEIVSFKILDKNRRETDCCSQDEKIIIHVKYNVYNEDIKKPVLGVAIRDVAHEYICGLNTLLDRIDIPWKKGENEFYLEYTVGILSIGGRYYFDVALFEETATVPIQYISKVKEIVVATRYVGEGKYIIPHKWMETINE